MTPSFGSPGANRLPLERQQAGQRAERGVDPVGRRQLVGRDALRAQHARAPVLLPRPFRRQAPGQHRRARVREDLHRGRRRGRRPVPLEAVGGRDGEHLEAHLHPRVERDAGPSGRRRVAKAWRLQVARSRSVRRERPLAAHAGGASIAITSAAASSISGPSRSTEILDATRRGRRRSSSTTRSRPFREAPTSIPRARTGQSRIRPTVSAGGGRGSSAGRCASARRAPGRPSRRGPPSRAPAR